MTSLILLSYNKGLSKTGVIGLYLIYQVSNYKFRSSDWEQMEFLFSFTNHKN